MSSPRQTTLKEAAGILAPLLGVKQSALRFPGRQPDTIVAPNGLTFAIQRIQSSAAAPVANAAAAARDRANEIGHDAIPLLISPFMSEAARQRCEAAGVAWLDLSGNARIFGPGMRIYVVGHPNRFKQRGRPASVFAPQSARLTRWFLMHGDRAWSQRELAQATHMDEGFVSRLVAKLEQDRLILRDEDGRLRARDPDLLLDAWQEQYRFNRHETIRGHVPARSGDVLLREMGSALANARVDYAATGLAAAWLLTHFAGFRLVSIYLKGRPSPALLERISFQKEERGANVWLIVPNDEGVFQGAATVDGIACVHPVQAFLDLGAQPERAREAAAELRKRLLTWDSDG